MGLVKGVCCSCGKTIRRDSPIPKVAVCDCYEYCPVCGALMTPYNPDLSPRTYRNEDDPEWDLLRYASRSEVSAETFYVCYNHTPAYYSNRRPMEVLLE